MPFDVEMPDGTVIQDVPDGTTRAQIQAKYQAHNQKSPMTLGSVLGDATANLIPSTVNLGKNLYTAVRHPLDTASGLLDVGAGELQKLTPEPIRNAINSMTPENAARANDAATAANKFYVDRYGSPENILRSISSDPAGVLADASIIAGPAGAAINPLRAPAALAGKIGSGASYLAKQGLGLTTGAGPRSLEIAYQAGKQGGAPEAALTGSMRGQVPIENVVDTAKQGLRQLEIKRGADYRAGIGPALNDPQTLSLGPVRNAFDQARGINSFEGVDLAPSTTKIRSDISNAIDEWETNPNQKFQTAAGLDALKRRIGDIRDNTQYGTPERKLANDIYSAVRGTVANQAPGYASTMADYAKASDQLEELRRTFSLKEGNMRDTSIRKLQSSLRDNVNTSYGRRDALAQQLASAGSPNLMESLAGQTLSSATPRSLGRLLAGGEGAAALTAAAMGHPATAAAMLPALALSSPRLVGEGALLAGKTARLAKALKNPIDARQALLAEQAGAQQNNPYAPQSASALGAYLMGEGK